MLYIVSFFLMISTTLMHDSIHRQQIVFTNLENKTGKIFIACYNKESDFGKVEKVFRSRSIEVKGVASATTILEDLPAGTYAIAAFLDENGNGKMDTNLFGIPKEKYGFSNNARPLMRAANFHEAAFVVGESNTTLTIKLK